MATYTKGSTSDTWTFSGNMSVGGTFAVTGATTFSGNFTLGDAVADVTILKGRFSTGTAAGTALEIDATTYQYAQGMYLRYNVADWADTYTLTNFRGLYLRAETNEANASGTLMGAEVYGVANNVNLQHLKGILSYAYIKGTTAKTVATAYGLHAELSWDAGASTTTLSTEAMPILAKITGGVVDTYTKIHGIVVRAGDMDGQSRTYGNALLIEDDGDMAGTITWTTGINVTIPTTTAVSVTAAAATTVLNIDAGTTDHTGANIITCNLDVNSASVKFINADIDVGTALSAGEAVYGVYLDVAGLAGDDAGSSITAYYATGDVTTAATVTGMILAGAWDTAISITGTSTTAVSITGASTTAMSVTAGATTTVLSVDAGTTDHTGASLIVVNLDVNSASCKLLDADIDVGTALSAAEHVYGTYIDINGDAGDDATSSMTGYYATSANTTGGVNTGVSLAGTWDTGVLIAAATTTGVSITGATTTAISTSGTSGSVAGRVLKGTMTVNNAAYGDGYGLVEAELTLTGTDTDHVAAFASWINMASGTHGSGGNFVAAQNNGIWEDAAATITGAKIIFGMRAQCICADTDAYYFPFSLNNNANTTTAIFDLNDPAAELGLITNAGSDAGTLVPLYRTNGGSIGYVKIYATA